MSHKPAIFLLACAIVAVAILLPANALGATPKTLWEKCNGSIDPVHCQKPGGIAVDQQTGEVFVAEPGRSRVSVFDVWGRFLRGWGWGVATGANALESCGPDATPPTTSCLPGIDGVGPGQFADLRSVAVDPSGDVYAYEAPSCTGCGLDPITARVQKFTADGEFLLMFGGAVNASKAALRQQQEANGEPVTITRQEENVCVAGAGDLCAAGQKGSEDGEFGTGALLPVDPPASTVIAAAPDGTIRTGGQGRIQVFGSDGVFRESIPLPGKLVYALAVDAKGNSIVALSALDKTPGNPLLEPTEDEVLVLGATGQEICSTTIDSPRAVATAGGTDIYVLSGNEGGNSGGTSEPLVRVHTITAGCAEPDPSFGVAGLDFPDVPTGVAGNAACTTGEGRPVVAIRPENGSPTGLLRTYYPPPDPVLCPPPSVPPRIGAQYAYTVNATSAVVKAEINPRFWPDVTYYVQYGTAPCASSPQACQQTVLEPGAQLSASDDAAVKSAGVALSGLEPDTTYYFRFVANSGGGGPVYGVDGDGSGPQGTGPSEGISGRFDTYPLPGSPSAVCANAPLRTGSSARLPDCRAYEMVSPVDKAGGDIATISFPEAALDRSSLDGDRVTFSSYRAFGGSEGAPFSAQYLSERQASGWSTDPLSPPVSGRRVGPAVANTTSWFRAFGEDLCTAWLLHSPEPRLAVDALGGYLNLYQRDNCGAGAGNYDSLTRTAPTFEPQLGEVAPLPPEEFQPSIQGFSADEQHVVFTVKGKITDTGSRCSVAERKGGEECPVQAYESFDGEVRPVCVLPNGTPYSGRCTVGSFFRVGEWTFTKNSVQHAISDSGRHVFWQSATNGLYVRIDGTETKAITASPSFFWGAAANGSKAIYQTGDKLFEYRLAANERPEIADEVSGVMGIDEAASVVYFTSKEVIAGSGQNSEEEEARPGEENLYRYDAGSEASTFVATLVSSDLSGGFPASVTPVPAERWARVTPSGDAVSFVSAASLTGVENVDSRSGLPDRQVFHYDAGSKVLRCVSCSPAGARPRFGRELPAPAFGVTYAAYLPGWADQTHPSRLLSADGSRLFFNSTEPLVLGDTNAKLDVYEWQEGDSQAACEAQGAELYLKREGGCLSLISTGRSASDSEFVDADPDGSDVFIRTRESLLPQDPGLIDIYDARVGGGFPPPTAPPAACEGEACQGVASPPAPVAPASESFRGAGNQSEERTERRRCPKGKRKAKKKGGGTRCVAKKKHTERKSHSRGGRGGRR